MPRQDDQPTIISRHPPVPPPYAVSDSTYRILQGKILPGDRLGHFELTEYIGGGGMGRVFRALDTRLARHVALKILSPEQAADEDTRLRFQNEAQSVARLDHENIARVYYVGEDRGVHYIVFEYIAGVNVRTLVERKGPLSLAEAVSYTLQVVEALAHAAQHDVVHRDIKPSNVLITPQGRVKLIDMGLARLKQADPAAADLTASGVTLGTFDYISPEQARDPRNADVRSDLYSLGCTFFYMLAGRPPFPEGTVLQKLLQHQGDQPPDVRQFRPELPDDVARVIRKMLAKDPRHRYASPADLVADLLTLADQVGLQPVGPGARMWLAPRRSRLELLYRHLPWLVPAAALLGIVLLLRWSWDGQHGNRQPPPLLNESEESGAASLAPGDRGGPSGAAISPNVSSKRSDTPASLPGAGQRTPPGLLDQPPGRIGARPWDLFGTPRSNGDPLGLDTIHGGPSLTGTPAGLALGLGNQTPSGRLFSPPGSVTPSPAGSPGAEPVTKRSGLLAVEENPEGENRFATLAAACNAAVDGDVIELRFNGRREEKPMHLANLRATIRAGKGFQPVIAFRPTEPDPVLCPRSMLTATAGHLRLIDVALQFCIPAKVPAENWSLFETRGPQTLKLERCTLSICNASDQLHEEVAFFRTKPASDGGSAKPESPPAAAPETIIELRDCIARGEAVFLRTEDLQPVHLSWENGLLVTTERLLMVPGAQEAARPGDALRLDLRHLTAVVRDGLCQMIDSKGAPHQLPVQIRCDDSILLGTPGKPLIEQDGLAGADAMRRRVTWIGDRNFFEGFDVFWMLDDFDMETPPEKMDFDAWRAHWRTPGENLKSRAPLSWKKSPAANRPVHTHTPDDYLLDESAAGNPALGAASDLHDAGFLADKLPQPPPRPRSKNRRPGRPGVELAGFQGTPVRGRRQPAHNS